MAMWSEDDLYRAREEQLRINTGAKLPVPTREELASQKDALIKEVASISRRRMIHKVVDDLKNVATKLKPFMLSLDMYATRHRDCPSIEKTVEDLRGAIYTMVHEVSQKNIRVAMTNPDHQRHIGSIRTHLATISSLLEDDCIELDVQMDCKNDERLARRLQAEMGDW